MFDSSVPGIEPTYSRHLGLPNLSSFGIELGFLDTFSTFRFQESRSSGIEPTYSRHIGFRVLESRNRGIESSYPWGSLLLVGNRVFSKGSAMKLQESRIHPGIEESRACTYGEIVFFCGNRDFPKGSAM